MRPRLNRCLAVLAVAALPLLASCDKAQQPPAPPAPPPSVNVMKVKKQDVSPAYTFTGRVAAIDRVELRARIDGFLEQRLFVEGKDVSKGELLFVIEKAPYRAAVSEAEGALQSGQAALTRAETEYRRQATLEDKGVSAKAKLEDAVAQRDQARGNVAQLKAKLERAQLNLSYTDIHAPIDGRIGRSQLSVGNFIGPASGALATVVSHDPIRIDFAVSQREVLLLRERYGAQRMAKDALVRVLLPNGKLYDHPGVIDFIDVSVNQGTDAVQVGAVLPNPDRILVDGQLIGAVVQAGQSQASLVIPQSALQLDQSGTYVLALATGNTVEVRRVELGAAEGTDVVVLSGLAEGDVIVTEGAQKVRPGQIVQPNETQPGA